MLFPRRATTPGFVLRLIVEVQVLRYLLALLPVVIAMLIWPHLALPISQAPIPMLFLIYFVETRMLNLTAKQRAEILDEAEADRLRDALEFNAKRVLTRIGARKKIGAGNLQMVIEQSELARLPVLSLVSVQVDTPKPEVLDLDDVDRKMIETGLFDDLLTEQSLHRLTLYAARNLHCITLPAGQISAQARMAAMTKADQAPVQTRVV